MFFFAVFRLYPSQQHRGFVVLCINCYKLMAYFSSHLIVLIHKGPFCTINLHYPYPKMVLYVVNISPSCWNSLWTDCVHEFVSACK